MRDGSTLRIEMREDVSDGIAQECVHLRLVQLPEVQGDDLPAHRADREDGDVNAPPLLKDRRDRPVLAHDG